MLNGKMRVLATLKHYGYTVEAMGNRRKVLQSTTTAYLNVDADVKKIFTEGRLVELNEVTATGYLHDVKMLEVGDEVVLDGVTHSVQGTKRTGRNEVTLTLSGK